MSFVKSARLPEWVMNNRGTLYVSQSLMHEIEYLHRNVGNLEWCGPLIYEKLEGSISKPETLKIRAHHVYPMDIGSGAHTSATFTGEDIVNIYDAHPELLREESPWKQGLIHTHHTMSTFFSGTDMDELHDNTPNHNYYLSFIVNFNGEWKAKVAFVATIKETAKQKFLFKDTEDQEASFDSTSSSEKQVLMMIDMDIVKEGADLVSQEFQARFLKLKEEKAKRVYSSPSIYSGASAVRSVHTQVPGTQGGSESAYKGKQSMEQGQLWQGDTSQQSGIQWHKKSEIPTGDQLWEDTRDWKETPGGILLPKEDPTYQPEISGRNSSVGYTEQETEESTEKKTQTVGHKDRLGQIQAKEFAVAWLKDGCIQEMQIPLRSFRDVIDGVAFFDNYFENDFGDPNYSYWLDCMSKALYYMTEDYAPAVVSTQMCRVFETYMNNSRVAHDLWSIADVHPLTYIEIQEERKQRKRKANGN